MDVKLLKETEILVIMTDEYPVEEYNCFLQVTMTFTCIRPTHPFIIKKKWVSGKGEILVLGVPGLANARVVRSPKGQLK